jgi:DNA-binding response OmpR family regulator
MNDFSDYRENIFEALKQTGLKPEGYQPKNKANFLKILAKYNPDVILLGIGASESKPDFLLNQVQDWLAEQKLDTPIWMIIEPKDESIAVNAMYQGVADYFFADRLSRIGPAAARLVGRNKQSFESVDLNRVVEAVFEEFLPIFQARGLELTFLPAVDLPLIFGRPEPLTQAILSILENVAAAVPDNTRTEMRPYLDPLKGEVCLEIKLSGPGLQTEQQIKETAVSETTIKGPRDIIETQRGKIEIDGGGAFGIRIWASFPAILDKQVKGNPNLLVVENSVLMRSILQEALEQEGFTVREAEHGVDALKKMVDFRPDLIISDIVMPLMDGFAFFEAVREKPEWQEIPFIFVTGQSDQKEHLNTQVLRGATYLIKPIIIEELLVAVRSRLPS